MRTNITVAPTCRPVDLESVKRHCRVEVGFTEDDDVLKAYIDAAQGVVEDITNRKLSTQTVTLYLDEFPTEDYIELPYYPLRSVPSTGITYTGSSGNTTTFGSTYWDTDIYNEPGRVVLTYGDEWPTDTLSQTNPVQIRFNCGYKSTEVPAKLKLAVRLLAAHYYENREASIALYNSAGMTEIPLGIKNLLYSERKYTF